MAMGEGLPRPRGTGDSGPAGGPAIQDVVFQDGEQLSAKCWRLPSVLRVVAFLGSLVAVRTLLGFVFMEKKKSESVLKK